MPNTIAAIATAHGVGSIAIVRLSGNEALHIAHQLTKSTAIAPRFAHLKSLYATDGTLIDEAIVIYFASPKSFTGEDVVEFQCHGGYTVASMVLDSVLNLGARLAQAGEFSKRAFLNERIDLTQAQAISSLIEAKSQEAAKVLAQQLKGSLGLYLDTIRATLVELVAYTEVSIDYAEEDLPSSLIHDMQEKLHAITAKLLTSIQASKQRRVLFDGFRVAIVGRPNVGKSSLLNALLHYDRAIVSDIAGTTRDTIEESITIGTHLVRIIDTAGIRNSQETIEAIGIKRSLQAISEANIVVAVFDSAQALQEDDTTLLKELHDARVPVLYVLNKSDLPQAIDTAVFEDKKLIRLSAKNSTQELIDALSDIMKQSSSANEHILVSKQQIQLVQEAVDEINSAYEFLDEQNLELFAFHINSAIEAIGKLTRPVAYDEMLDSMFSNFCLGK